MAKGFDTSTPLTALTASAFAADGYRFVCRYLVPTGYAKRITRQEAEVITQAGMSIVSVYETTAERALGGRTAGLADGAAARQVALDIRQPKRTAIYFAVDFDVTSTQMSTITAYFRALREVVPDYLIGVYGSYEVVEALAANGAADRFWQTYAWSNGQRSDDANLYQYQNDITENGVAIDLNESYGNEGWWTTTDKNGEDEGPLNLEHEWQWQMLASALQGLTAKGLLNDGSWLDKVNNRTLTASELAWLNMIVFARQNGKSV